MRPLLRLYEDHIEADARPIHLPGQDRAIYIRSGSLELASETVTQYLTAGLATTGGDQLTLSAVEDTVLWRWELTAAGRDDALRSAPQATSELRLEAEIDLDDRYRWLMRCDTVSFPPGGVAWTHVHQGPGIRIVREGEIAIEIDGHRAVHRPGDAWLERGVDPVLAPTTEDEATTFVRCFILPEQCRGQSSLRIVSAQDRAKGNTQSYRVLSERLVHAGGLD